VGLPVGQTAERFGVVARTVLYSVKICGLYAEPPDPEQLASDKIISLASIVALEKKRAQAAKA